MSVQSEIDRIKGNMAGAYSAVGEKGGALPAVQNSAGLAEAIRSIPTATAPSTPLDPVEVYKATRPADWLPMPEPADNEMYLLFHIPDGASALMAFIVLCTGKYTVEMGTVVDGQFVQQSSESFNGGTTYYGEVFADDFGDLTSDGMKQCMIKISGTGITQWYPWKHDKKGYSGGLYMDWNIVEIACRLPSGRAVTCGNTYASYSLRKLRYFSWYGKNAATTMEDAFQNCSSLICVLDLDTSNVTSMADMFAQCNNLKSIPKMDTSNVTNMNYMFNLCYGFSDFPQLDTSKVTNMASMFRCCYGMRSIPWLDTSKVTNMGYMFDSNVAIISLPRMNVTSATNMDGIFSRCSSLGEVTFSADSEWAGCDISLKDCSLDHQALVDFFNSLPAITSAKTLTLTNNPGAAELTDEEKAIATGKNWTLTL